MGKARPPQTSIDVANELVSKQREIVGSTEIGSRAHRQACDVLALIEESQFLLSEFRRLSSPAPQAIRTKPADGDKDKPSGRSRLSLKLVVAFAAALVAAAVALEVVDPAPMDLSASELSTKPARP